MAKETFAKMDLQTTFDKVSKHLLKQMEVSCDETGACRYRGPNNLRCAIGCLIPDKIYRKGIEGLGLGQIWNLIENMFESMGCDNLLSNLQMIHDDGQPSSWRHQLSVLAKLNHLNDSVLLIKRKNVKANINEKVEKGPS